jgi:hypothetical protein
MRLWTAILAALQILSGGAILTDVIGVKWVGLFVLLVAALQGGTIAYMKSDQGQSPESDFDGPEPRHAYRY